MTNPTQNLKDAHYSFINLNDFSSQTNNNLDEVQNSTFPEHNVNNDVLYDKSNKNISRDDQQDLIYIERNGSDSEDRLLLDKIINDYGYKWHTIKRFLATIIILFLTGYLVYNPVNNYSVIRVKMELSANFMIFLSCLALLCRSMGAFACGVILTKISITRRGLIYICLCCMLLSNILITIKYNLTFYIFFLIFGSFSAGNVEVLAINILCESLPIFLRGSFICLSQIGSSINDSFTNYLINSLSNKNEINIRTVLMIMNGLFIFCLILFYFLPLSDSARNLLKRGNYEEAFAILQKLKGSDLTEEEKEKLDREARNMSRLKINKKNHNENDEKNDEKHILLKTKREIEGYESDSINDMKNKSYIISLMKIFSKKYLKTTLILLIIRFMSYFVLSGTLNVLSLYLSKALDNSDINRISSAQFFIYLIVILSYPLSAFLIEIEFLGRRKALMILACLSLTVLAFFLFFHNVYYLLGIFYIFYQSKIMIIVTLISETYPTKIRDISIGLFIVVEVLGSISGIITNVLVIQKFVLAPYIISFGLITVCFLLFFCIENETHNIALDFIITEDDLNNHFSKRKGLEKHPSDDYKEIIRQTC